MTLRLRLRRLWFWMFPGRWTAAEVADIQRRADARYEAIKDLVE